MTVNRRSLTLPVVAVLLATAISVNGQTTKQMAITFDDLPFGYARGLTIDQRRDAVDHVLATRRNTTSRRRC
jgi:hypothetical protein